MPLKLKRILPALIFFSFICWIILQANTGSSSLFFTIASAFPYGDKLGHLMLYGILTLLSNVAVSFRRTSIANHNLSLGASMVLFFSFAEEFSQAFLPNRNFDSLDLSADLVGIFLFNWISARHVSPK